MISVMADSLVENNGTGASNSDTLLVVANVAEVPLTITAGYVTVSGEIDNVPDSWNDVTPISESDQIKARLMPSDTSEDACDSFYFCIGASGNLVNNESISVKITADGWYKGLEGTGTSSVDGLKIYSKNPEAAQAQGKIRSAANDDVLTVTHSGGLQNEIVLAGYSKIEWEVSDAVAAGFYSATVRFEIQPNNS